MDTQKDDYLRQAVKHLTALRNKTPSVLGDANSTQYSDALDDEDLLHAVRPHTTPQTLELPDGHHAVHHPHHDGRSQVPHDAASATTVVLPVSSHPSQLRTSWFSRPEPAKEDLASAFTFAKVTLPTTFSVRPSKGPVVEAEVSQPNQCNSFNYPPSTVQTPSSVESEGASSVAAQQHHQSPHIEADDVSRPADGSHQSPSQLKSREDSKDAEKSISPQCSLTIQAISNEYTMLQQEASSQQASFSNASEGHARISGESTAPSSHHSRQINQPRSDEMNAVLGNEESCSSETTIVADTEGQSGDALHELSNQVHASNISKGFAQCNGTFESQAPETSPAICSGDAIKMRRSSPKPRVTISEKTKNNQSEDVSQNVLSEEEMLIALLTRYKNDARDRAKARSREQAKDTEIGDLKEITHILHEQVLEREQQLAKTDAELEKVKGLVPGWKTRLRKLTDYVKGLNNDHRQLRENATEIQAQQVILHEEKDLLDASFRRTVLAVRQERQQHKDTLETNQSQIRVLEQELCSQKSQLASEHETLQAERLASQKLQENLSQLATNHQAAILKIEEQAQLILCKLAEAPATISAAEDVCPKIEQSENKLKLEECLKLLHELRQVERLNQETVTTLGISFQEQTHEICEQVRHFEQMWQSSQSSQLSLTPEIELRFHELASSLEASQPLNEQIMSLREVKATIAERLKATENSLIESRQYALLLERGEQAHSQKVSALEAELDVLRKQPQESPLLGLRLHESEKESKILNEKLQSHQNELFQMTDNFRERGEELTEVKDALRQVQSQLLDVQVRATILSEEKDCIIAKKASDERQLKVERAEMIEHEVKRAENRLQNQMQKLRHQTVITKDELQKQKEIVKTLQKRQENDLVATHREQTTIVELRQKLQASEERADQKAQEVEEQVAATKQLMRVAAEREDAIDELRQSRIKYEQNIQHHQSRIQDLEARNADLQELHDKVTAASKSQEEEIRRFKAEVASLRSLPRLESKPTVNSSPARVVEDSQDKLIKSATTQHPKVAAADASPNAPTTADTQHPRSLSADRLSSPMDSTSKEAQIEQLTHLPPDLDYDELFPSSSGVENDESSAKPLDHQNGSGENKPDLIQQHRLNISRSTTRTTVQSTVAPGSTTFSPWFSQMPYRTSSQHRSELNQSQRSRKSASRSQPQPKSILKQSNTFKQPKRTIPDSQDTQGRAKRRRMSTEVDSQNLGPTVRTPSADVKSSRRKVSLRSSQKESEMDRAFSRSLRAPSRQSTPA